MVAANLDIFAEGSVMGANAQGLYVMPGSRIRTLDDLRGQVIGVNAPGNILYLLTASVMADHGLRVSAARFAYYPLPEMAAMLKAGKIGAAVLPEPFASQAEQSMGVTLLADLDQGATSAFPVQGCAVTRPWAARHPRTLAAFRAAFEQGQRIADTSRSAVEQAMEALPKPLGVTPVTAAVMALDSYPVGPVDAVRVQRVADVMRQFLGFPDFNARSMIGGSSPRSRASDLLQAGQRRGDPRQRARSASSARPAARGRIRRTAGSSPPAAAAARCPRRTHGPQRPDAVVTQQHRGQALVAGNAVPPEQHVGERGEVGPQVERRLRRGTAAPAAANRRATARATVPCRRG